MIRSYDIYWEPEKDSDVSEQVNFQNATDTFRYYDKNFNLNERDKEYVYKNSNFGNANQSYPYNHGDESVRDDSLNNNTMSNYEKNNYQPIENSPRFISCDEVNYQGIEEVKCYNNENINDVKEKSNYSKCIPNNISNMYPYNNVNNNANINTNNNAGINASNSINNNAINVPNNNINNTENSFVNNNRNISINQARRPKIEKVEQIRHELNREIPQGFYEISSKDLTSNNLKKPLNVEKSDLYFEDFIRSNAQCNHISVNEVKKCIKSNSIELNVAESDTDLRRDLVLENRTVVRIWGQIKDNNGNSIDNAIVSLLKPEYIKGNLDYLCTATTMTDTKGFYQFDLDNDSEDTVYRIIVTKPSK